MKTHAHKTPQTKQNACSHRASASPEQKIEACSVGFGPIAVEWMRRIGIREIIDKMVPSEMRISCGQIIELMVLDTLCGRSPLYRLEEFAEHQDIELLLGEDIAARCFRDHNIGRAMDHIYRANPQKVFIAIAACAVRVFQLVTLIRHYDTTSAVVWGDYPRSGENGSLSVTYGYSKDKRPDLKQFMIETLCVERSIPIFGRCVDGNSSDVKLNNTLLERTSKLLKEHGIRDEAFIYVADSAMVSKENLEWFARDDNGKPRFFITRLPARYKVTDEAISEAVKANEWQDIGTLAETVLPSSKKPPARYRIYETTVTLYGDAYRAVVVHSSGHDKRRRKKLQRQLDADKEEANRKIKELSKQDFACQADAQAALDRVCRETAASLWRVTGETQEVPHYGRGRPPKGKPRPVRSRTWRLDLHIEQNAEAVGELEERAGCFVLITNLPPRGKKAKTGCEVLSGYKDQKGVEGNFSFLKDPLIVNDLFLKKPERIEVLGMVLLLALLVWRLIERTLRQHVEKTGKKLPGWDRKRTKRPTAFMFSIKFRRIIVIKQGNRRTLGRPITDEQREYLRALGLTEDIFITPRAP